MVSADEVVIRYIRVRLGDTDTLNQVDVLVRRIYLIVGVSEW